MADRSKYKIDGEFKQHVTDTGSMEVQIVSLTEDIRRLTDHFKDFPKDRNSKRGLLIKVGRRKTFLNYIKRKNEQLYNKLLRQLEIRG